MAKVRLALVGAGVIGKRHLAAMESVAEAELIGVADPFPGAVEIAALHDVPLFEDLETLLGKLKPDGVIIATPTEHHFKPTLLALDRGAHVLVEKPVMATMEEALQTVARVESSGCQVLVGHHRRYYGLVNQARDIVQGGKIGQLVAVSGQWNIRKHSSYYDPDWRKKWQAGPILTNLIHDMDLLRYIAGPVASISAETSNRVLNVEKEDAAALVMRFENGALGSFILSDQSHSPWGWEQATGENAAVPRTGQNAIRFMGTEGSLEFPNLKLWSSSAEAEWRSPLTAVDLSSPLEDAYINQIEHFCEVIRSEKAPLIDADDAANTLKATLAVYQSGKTGRRVDL